MNDGDVKLRADETAGDLGQIQCLLNCTTRHRSWMARAVGCEHYARGVTPEEAIQAAIELRDKPKRRRLEL